ncbi:cell division ATPase FtsA [Chryseobacterium sp. SORGH_AS1175]|nr:cell division ATPase FtsA [Chryseobacterium sp. SORGH_AS_1175]
MVNTELKAYGAFEQKKKLIAGIVLTGGGSNLKHLRQLANYTTGFDSRIGFANEYIANDKNQYLKGPEFATSIGLLMESLKIRDKKQNAASQEPVEEEKQPEASAAPVEVPQMAQQEQQPVHEQHMSNEHHDSRKAKLTFGQSLMEKVKKFFEEVE